MFACLLACVCVHHRPTWCPQGPEETIRCPETRVVYINCESPRWCREPDNSVLNAKLFLYSLSVSTANRPGGT